MDLASMKSVSHHHIAFIHPRKGELDLFFAIDRFMALPAAFNTSETLIFELVRLCASHILRFLVSLQGFEKFQLTPGTVVFPCKS
jgi:hypothetical protein